MTIVIYNSTNVLVDGISIIQQQFWASFISYSQNVTMTNIHVNATSNSEWGTVNTDGSDTWNSRDVVYENWDVTTDDDCIAIKGNSTNVFAKNITCHGSGGMPIGSVGQYPTKPDYVQDIWFEDVVIINGTSAAWVKTWQGVPADQTDNGDTGGGGSGFVKNITWKNYYVENMKLPIYVTQCTYGRDPAACDTSKVHSIRSLQFRDFS